MHLADLLSNATAFWTVVGLMLSCVAAAIALIREIRASSRETRKNNVRLQVVCEFCRRHAKTCTDPDEKAYWARRFEEIETGLGEDLAG